MNDCFYNGSFANSNSNDEWIDLKNAIENSETEQSINKDELKQY